ncbi:ciliogenesis-associated TTC17-interacting protein-like [Ptychodera flava]|uniref:ciliogenesis-associated TTC17-interacting protein-like n=1 Tax=Ptychodera flava TaxID=63121 RepID=UPI00396A1264
MEEEVNETTEEIVRESPDVEIPMDSGPEPTAAGDGGDVGTPEPLPKASMNALEYLQSIRDVEINKIMFTDSLVTTSDTGKELGEFTVTVEPARKNGEDCYLIHANSHGAIDSVPCGTSITAYVSKSLETLEQQHHEYVKLEDHPLDRKTFIVQQDGQFVVNKVITQGEDVQRTAQTYEKDSMQGFISEASNLLLQRIMVNKGITENCVFISFDSETNLSTATYRALDERKQTIGERELHVAGIERTIHSMHDLPTSWQSYFLSDGHLTSRVQVGSPVTMRLLRVPSRLDTDEAREKPVFKKQPLNWEEDMQLYSKFLDRKEELKGDHAVYMRHHPELKALLADFLQFLLLRKPDNVVAFAGDYFAAFSSKAPTGSAYATSTEGKYRRSASPSRSSQTL